MKTIFTPFLLFYAVLLSAQDGRIDSTFGTDGRVSTTVYPGLDITEKAKIIVLSTGKILQVFTVDNNFGIARYQNDDAATLDGSFGRYGGFDTTDFGGAVDGATSIIVQGDGKILLAGYTGSAFALVRYNENGTRDASFGIGGKVTTAFGATARANAVRIQNDGRIVLAGFSSVTTSPFSPTFALARYTSTGMLDNTFDTDGRVTTNFSPTNNDQAYAIVVQADGKIVAAGISFTASGSGFALARYNVNGSLDTGFDGDGKVTTAFGTDAGAFAVTLQADNKIIAAGYGGSATNSDFAVARYNANGGLDNTFDADGLVLTPVGSLGDIGFSVAVQNDGRILVAGSSVLTDDPLDNAFSIVRYTAAGIPDATFDTDGKNIIDFGPGDDNGYGLGSQGVNLIIGGVSGTSLALTRLTNSSFILPLSLYSFTAIKQSKAVLLNWQTINEQHTSAFEVQKSDNGSNFTGIGIIDAAGNSTSSKNYSLADLQPLAGLNYYRLKMIDIDGKFTFSKIITVRFDNAAVTLQAFPNPVNRMVNLQFVAPAGRVKLQLTDAVGRTVKSFEVKSSGLVTYTSIDMTGLQKGVYFIYVNSESIKVIKE
jgi:uncharacterized delta-60 repeat protein